MSMLVASRPVPWADSLPSGWQVRRLRTVAHVSTGGRDTVDRVDGAKYPFFVRSQRIERIDSYAFDGEAVLTAGDGAGVGKVFHHVDGRFDFHQRVYKFSDFRDVDGRYFFHYLRAFLGQVTAAGTAKSTVDSLRRPMLLDFPLIVPPLPEQQVLARYLDHVELLISRAVGGKRRLISLLGEAAEAKRWVALVGGGAGPPNAGPPWMGNIPGHWQPYRLKDLLREFDQRTRMGNEPLLSLRMREGLVPAADFSRKPQDPRALVGYKLVEPGTLVMNRMRASIGLFGIAEGTGLVSPDYATFRPQPTAEVHLPFLLGLLKSSRLGAVIRSESRGMGTGSSGFLRIYTDRFGTIPVALPPAPEQVERAAAAQAVTSDLTTAADSATREIELLQEYRARVVADVLTGRRDVRAEAASLPAVDSGELDAVLSTASPADEADEDDQE